jgi:hypothetical protein
MSNDEKDIVTPEEEIAEDVVEEEFDEELDEGDVNDFIDEEDLDIPDNDETE